MQVVKAYTTVFAELDWKKRNLEGIDQPDHIAYNTVLAALCVKGQCMDEAEHPRVSSGEGYDGLILHHLASLPGLELFHQMELLSSLYRALTRFQNLHPSGVR